MNTITPFQIPDSEAAVRDVSNELIVSIEEWYKARIQDALAHEHANTGFQVQCVVLSRELYLKQPEVWKGIAPKGASLEEILSGTITHHIDRMAYYLSHHINRTEPIFDSLEDVANVPLVQLGWYEFDLSTTQELIPDESCWRIDLTRIFSFADAFRRLEKMNKIKITKHGLTEEGRRVLEAYNDIKRTYWQGNSITPASPEIQI